MVLNSFRGTAYYMQNPRMLPYNYRSGDFEENYIEKLVRLPDTPRTFEGVISAIEVITSEQIMVLQDWLKVYEILLGELKVAVSQG